MLGVYGKIKILCQKKPVFPGRDPLQNTSRDYAPSITAFLNLLSNQIKEREVLANLNVQTF